MHPPPQPQCCTSNKRRATEIKEKDRYYIKKGGENVNCQSGPDASAIELLSLEEEEREADVGARVAERNDWKEEKERREGGERRVVIAREPGTACL